MVDLLLARNNPRTLLDGIDATFPYDFNRDAQIDATDVLLARNNRTSFFNALELIDLSAMAAEAQQAPVADLVWLAEYEATAQSPAEEDDSTAAVDKLLATYWP